MSGSCLHISLLGDFLITYDSGLTPTFSGDRPISLLAYLLLHRQSPISRQYLAFTLWPDSTDSQARTNLRNLYYTLRHTLPDADSYIAADSMTLQWRADADVTLDVAEFEDRGFCISPNQVQSKIQESGPGRDIVSFR